MKFQILLFLISHEPSAVNCQIIINTTFRFCLNILTSLIGAELAFTLTKRHGQHYSIIKDHVLHLFLCLASVNVCVIFVSL